MRGLVRARAQYLSSRFQLDYDDRAFPTTDEMATGT